MLTLRWLVDLLALLCVVVRTFRAGMLVTRCAVLSGRCSLRRHLQFANLALRKASVVIVGALLLLLRLLGLLGRLWRLRLLVHVGWLVGPIEIYTSRRRWYLALSFK